MVQETKRAAKSHLMDVNNQPEKWTDIKPITCKSYRFFLLLKEEMLAMAASVAMANNIIYTTETVQVLIQAHKQKLFF